MSTVRAPLPDFRLVELQPYRRPNVEIIGALASSIAVLVSSLPVVGGLHAAAGGAGMFGLALTYAWVRRPGDRLARAATPARMTVSPWGVVVEHPEGDRALRWSAIQAVQFEAAHRTSVGESRTLHTVVVVETQSGEKLSGLSLTDVPLERLVTYLPQYQDEQAVSFAADLERPVPADSIEGLLSAVDASALNHGAYRGTENSLESLRTSLHAAHALSMLDPRPFVMLLAARLGHASLASSILSLVQSPHPLVAAVAKRSAQVLGIPEQRTGNLDELSAFVDPFDLALLRAWCA